MVDDAASAGVEEPDLGMAGNAASARSVEAVCVSMADDAPSKV